MSGDAVQIPDDRAFINFKNECNSEEGWNSNCNKSGITIWIQILRRGESIA
uniref:START domain-containing protein n=1 Tax=Anguilla anguilla TaxID=7936 RepID=A0A0E9Q9X0_ANGAN